MVNVLKDVRRPLICGSYASLQTTQYSRPNFIKYFSEYAYPFIYIDDVLITIGHFPSRGEFIAFLLQDEIKGISKDEIEELARNYGFTIDE